MCFSFTSVYQQTLRSKLKSQAQTQANELESEYRSVLSSGNTDKAIELLIELIYTDNNTPQRRKELRELYSKQCPAGEDATEYGYLRVMEIRWGVNENKRDKPIRGAKEDYKSYIDDLLIQAQEYDYDKDVNDNAVRIARQIAKFLKGEHDTPKIELIKWFTRGKDYDSAWEILEKSSSFYEKDLITFAIKTFQSAYDKYKKNGNNDNNDYRRVTWILASLFKKIGDITKAIPKFIECKDFRSAYELVDIHSVESIRFALEEFKGHDENHVKALSLMINRHADFEKMYTVKKLPDNFAMKWFFLNALYAIYRVYSLAGTPVAIVMAVFIFFASPYLAPSTGSLMVMMLTIPALVLCNDIRLQSEWVALHKLYASIIAMVGDHPQMAPLQGKFYKNLSTEAGTQKKLILVLLYFFLCMFISYVAMSNTAQRAPVAQESVVSAKNQPATATETPRDEELVAPQTKVVTAEEDTSYLDARTDLSLNGIDLGISIAEAQSKLGQPVKVEHLDNHDRQYYSDDFYISVANNKVTALVTHDPKFKTRRGLHAGSTYDEIIDQYGTNSADMTVDNLTLHEYSFDTINGEHALLRFAVDSSNRVDYISIRVVDPPAPRENTDSKGQYVGTYNSGMKAYIVPGTLKVSSDRNSCNVRILAEDDAGDIAYLDYRIWREGNSLHFSNSEGYSGVIASNMTVENKIWEIAQNQF